MNFQSYDVLSCDVMHLSEVFAFRPSVRTSLTLQTINYSKDMFVLYNYKNFVGQLVSTVDLF